MIVRRLGSSIRVFQASSGDANLWIGDHHLDHLWDCIANRERVAVQQQDEAPMAELDRLVVGPGETNVFGIFDQVNFREFMPDHLGATICRGIVHQDNFRGEPLKRIKSGLQAMPKQVTPVPVNDDYRNLERSSYS